MIQKLVALQHYRREDEIAGFTSIPPGDGTTFEPILRLVQVICAAGGAFVYWPHEEADERESLDEAMEGVPIELRYIAIAGNFVAVSDYDAPWHRAWVTSKPELVNRFELFARIFPDDRWFVCWRRDSRAVPQPIVSPPGLDAREQHNYIMGVLRENFDLVVTAVHDGNPIRLSYNSDGKELAECAVLSADECLASSSWFKQHEGLLVWNTDNLEWDVV